MKGTYHLFHINTYSNLEHWYGCDELIIGVVYYDDTFPSLDAILESKYVSDTDLSDERYFALDLPLTFHKSFVKDDKYLTMNYHIYRGSLDNISGYKRDKRYLAYCGS
jgi:hypothetical protein